ncbi:MAG: branched-chain amino acid ABC transporter permease [Ignavibacteriales bacterium]
MAYIEGVLIIICVNLMGVLGVSLLTGFTGIFSFGHAAYMAIGAYTSAIVVGRLGMPFIVGLLAAAGTATVASLIIGYPTLKLVGDYFAIAALGFGEATRLLLDNGGEFTGGPRGFVGVPKHTTLLVAFLIVVLGVWLMRNIVGSRFGRSFLAIREDRLAAEAMGIDTARFRIMSLAISAAYAGVAGSMFAHYLMYLQPVMFDINKSTELASTVVFGGLGSLTGSVVACVVLTAIPELFRPFYLWRMVFYGLALVSTIVLRPQGLLGTYEFSLAGFKGLAAGRSKRTGAAGGSGTGAGPADWGVQGGGRP